jgi:transcriptional regulator
MMLSPKGDTVITMARKVFEKSELNFLDVSFSTRDGVVVVKEHCPKGSVRVIEEVTHTDLLISYIGLSLETDLDKNDSVTTGHRLGRTYR